MYPALINFQFPPEATAVLMYVIFHLLCNIYLFSAILVTQAYLPNLVVYLTPPFILGPFSVKNIPLGSFHIDRRGKVISMYVLGLMEFFQHGCRYTLLCRIRNFICSGPCFL
jgi:hypothetical protein